MRFFAVLGFLLAVLLAIGAIYLFSGAYRVSATLPHSEVVRWSLDRIQTSSIRSHADEVSPIPDLKAEDPRQALEDFHGMCVTCHGAPGVEASEIGRGLNPAPPELSRVAHRSSARPSCSGP